jgi:hypothetical protein
VEGAQGREAHEDGAREQRAKEQQGAGDERENGKVK